MSIKPALSAEEWAEVLEPSEYEPDRIAGTGAFGWARTINVYRDGRVENGCCGCEMPGAHQTAALCLYGQPFGFRRERLENLRQIIGWATAFVRSRFALDESIESKLADALSDADRIEALLPPEEE